jgi:hypothetical protein
VQLLNQKSCDLVVDERMIFLMDIFYVKTSAVWSTIPDDSGNRSVLGERIDYHPIGAQGLPSIAMTALNASLGSKWYEGTSMHSNVRSAGKQREHRMRRQVGIGFHRYGFIAERTDFFK